MDERLKQIVPRLRKLFRYSDYTPIEHHKVDVEFGVSKRLPAPGDRSLEVTPKDLQGKSVRMQVRLLKGEKSVMTSNIVAAPGAPGDRRRSTPRHRRAHHHPLGRSRSPRRRRSDPAGVGRD